METTCEGCRHLGDENVAIIPESRASDWRAAGRPTYHEQPGMWDILCPDCLEGRGVAAEEVI